MRGDGRLYREPGSRYWWCAYYVHGKEVRQSTRETDERRARRVLRGHLANVLRGDCIPHEHRVTLGDLVAMVRAHYDVHQRRSRTTVTYPLKHFTAQLGAETPALALTRAPPSRLNQYDTRSSNVAWDDVWRWWSRRSSGASQRRGTRGRARRRKRFAGRKSFCGAPVASRGPRSRGVSISRPKPRPRCG